MSYLVFLVSFLLLLSFCKVEYIHLVAWFDSYMFSTYWTKELCQQETDPQICTLREQVQSHLKFLKFLRFGFELGPL